MDSHSAQGIRFGPFRLLITERLLEKDGEPVALGSRALDILITLVERAGDVIDKKDLIARVWPNVTVDESSLRVHLAALRKVLGDGGAETRYIVNIPGRGYCFVAPIARQASATIAPPPAAKPQPSERSRRLPPRLMRMVGRDELIRELAGQIENRKLVTIHGPGGIGKTTTAIAIGHALLADFDGGVYFVDLGLISDPTLVPGSLASVLGIPVQSSDTGAAVVNFLRGRRTLLILDSCEHVIDMVAGLAERIIQEAPHVSIIATSREPLRSEGEHVHRLSPLQSPPDDAELTTEQTLSFPAAHLLVERAMASNHQFKLDDMDAPIVAEICRKLDGIALAIELAAGRISTHGLHETAALLDQRMKLLWRGRRTASPRHQTMTATLDWSYELISERERTVLRRLSIFVGAFTLEAAQAVASDDTLDLIEVTDALEQLASKSLISTANASEASTRYRLLDTTRAYARAKLDELGETPSVNRRHALYWQRRLERAHANKVIAGQSEASETRPEDLGNIRAALEYSLSEHGDHDLGIALAAAAAPLFTNFSLLSECYQWTGQALSLLSEDTRDTRYEMELQAAFGHAMMFTRGNSNKALAALTKGLQLAEQLKDRFYQFRLLSDLHMFRLRTGRFYDTLALAQRAKAVAEDIADPVGLSAAHRLLSSAHHLVGNQAEARTHLETWQPPPSQIADTSAFNAGRVPRIGLSRVLWLLGLPDQAVRAAEIADEDANHVKSPVPVCIVTIWGASVYSWIGDWTTVDARADRLIAFAQKYSLDPHIAVGIGIKGMVLIQRGETERGVTLLRDSLTKLRTDRYELYAPGLSLALAEGLGICGRVDDGLAVINETIAIVNSNGGSLDLPEQLRIKGTLLLLAGDQGAAEEAFRYSLDLAEKQSALSWQLRTATSLAHLKTRQGDGIAACETLANIYGRFTEGFDTTDLRAAKSLLNETSATRTAEALKPQASCPRRASSSPAEM
ncbi:putative ATPase/DNA-binding winged helix-turn-helix (wHTH) protein [Nitrobacteraceae bacterium AZCC 1564]